MHQARIRNLPARPKIQTFQFCQPVAGCNIVGVGDKSQTDIAYPGTTAQVQHFQVWASGHQQLTSGVRYSLAKTKVNNNQRGQLAWKKHGSLQNQITDARTSRQVYVGDCRNICDDGVQSRFLHCQHLYLLDSSGFQALDNTRCGQ